MAKRDADAADMPAVDNAKLVRADAPVPFVPHPKSAAAVAACDERRSNLASYLHALPHDMFQAYFPERYLSRCRCTSCGKRTHDFRVMFRYFEHIDEALDPNNAKAAIPVCICRACHDRRANGPWPFCSICGGDGLGCPSPDELDGLRLPRPKVPTFWTAGCHDSTLEVVLTGLICLVCASTYNASSGQSDGDDDSDSSNSHSSDIVERCDRCIGTAAPEDFFDGAWGMRFCRSCADVLPHCAMCDDVLGNNCHVHARARKGRGVLCEYCFQDLCRDKGQLAAEQSWKCRVEKK